MDEDHQGSEVTNVSADLQKVNEDEASVKKRSVKLTQKVLLSKLGGLETLRKSKLSKAANIKQTVQGLMCQSGYEAEIKGSFSKYQALIKDAKVAHNQLLELLPVDEKERHETWFKAKLLSVNEFCHCVENRFKSANNGTTETVALEDDIKPTDSVSNVGTSSCTKSRTSERSSRSSKAALEVVHAQAKARKAALIARAAALKKKHELEREVESIRKKLEQVEMDAEIEASDAELAVLQTFSDQDGMESYIEKQKSKESPNVSEAKFEKSTRLMSNKGLSTANVAHAVDDNSTQQILQRQNEISELLLQQHKASQLPPRQLPVFEGDPLKFKMFMQAFKHCVEEKAASKGDCMYFLERYTRGRPHDLVQSCLHMSAERGFETAKALLREHFGNETKITAAYMEKVLNWPVVKPEGVLFLQDYALFLRGCYNAMSDLEDMKELDLPANLKTIVSKLPFKLREKFRSSACGIRERQLRKPNFKDVVHFVEYEVKILSDPIFGDIQSTERERQVKRDVYTAKPRSKQGNFATNVCAVSKVQRRDTQEGKHRESNIGINCLFCLQDHSLDECQQLAKNKHREKINFLKEKGVCFGCLNIGHLSKNCDKRKTCEKCKQSHPTALHIHVKQVDKSMNSSGIYPKEPKPAVNHTLVSAQTFGNQTGAGGSGMLSILPVQVKAQKGNKVIQTYAFLDNGSTSTFCSEALMRRLNLTGTKSKIGLLTMSPKTSVSTYIVNGLEVASLNGTRYYSLPNVYTQKKMPVDTANIIKPEDVSQWPYLDHIEIPEIDATVELLIGTNASKLLEPWEIVNSQGEGPFAVKILLGWVINGLGKDSKDNRNGIGYPSVSVNRLSVESLQLLLEKQYQSDFNEKIADDNEEMSRQEARFIKIMDQSVKLKDGHYSLKLPFKAQEVTLPNNRCIAQQRLIGLRRKMERNEKFHQEYTSFLENVISSGYAEMVPQDELRCGEDNLFYIPHHGVYHPRKGKLRVVFDCGAKFKGTSLNEQLLQGPNLTSSLIGVFLRFRQEPVAFMSDVKSMFYQVRVADEDKDFLRFLWWPNGDLHKQVEEYRMTVHLFGAVSSPSCACYALRKTAEDSRNGFSEEDDPEVKVEISTNAITIQEDNATSQLITYFSDWKRLKVAVAWLLLVKGTLLELSQRRKQLVKDGMANLDVDRKMLEARRSFKRERVSTEDLLAAENAILQFCQRERFDTEICALKTGKPVKGCSTIYKLNPVLEEGLVRVGGRLSRTAMPEESKHPVILCKDQHISMLILKNIHEQTRHGGRNYILSKLREKFWVTHANAAARKILSNCPFCRRHQGKLCDQKMSDLPKERITPDFPPFTNVGVDYFGPIEVKQGRSYVKRYGVIFTCMASRAIHLEVAHSLDTDSCISAIRRFICRRGPVAHFRSDNGTNFTGAEKELKRAIADLNHRSIEKALIHDNIKWTFNPPAASHHGGAWESMIRLVRKVLVSVLHLQTLTDETLVTVLCEAEAILNDRPITRVSEDPNDLEPLTPNHLLTLKRIPVLPPGLFDQKDQYVRRRWKQAQYLSDLFWKRWTKEYLATLQERQKWNKTQRNLMEGDIVLIADATAPRNSWMIGRIIKSFPDKSGIVRSVQIKTKTNVIERPVTKLGLLVEQSM